MLPSPKFHERFVIVPVELSVKVTANGFRPLVGAPLKLATGTTAPEPVTELLRLPALLVNTTTLLKLPVPAGLKATETMSVWPAVKLNELPATILKGAAVAAVPVRVCPPVLTTWNASVFVWPTITGPNTRAGGDTLNCGPTGALTVMFTAAEVLMIPAASIARAVSE